MQAVIKPIPEMDFSQFYQAHMPAIRAIVRQFNFHDASADDLVQDIFIKAWRGLSGLDNQAALGAWLKVIARNHCINEVKTLRKMQRHMVPVDELALEVAESVSCEIFEMSLMQLEQSLDVLRDLIAHHKDPIRGEIARLFYLENYTIRDICRATQLKQNTVLSHLRRFRLITGKAMQRWMENTIGS